MPTEKIVENTERPRRKDNAQALDYSLKRLAKRRGPGHRPQHNQNHGRKCQEHVEGDGLREGDTVWNNAKDCAAESMKER